jgi:general secretion pathway protein K
VKDVSKATTHKQSKNPFLILRSQRGIALLIAMFSITIMLYLAVELAYESAVEYTVTSKAVNRLKSYYLAKSSVELGLLRIHLYRQAISAVGDQLGSSKSMLDPIWNFPFAWPISEIAADQMGSGDKELIKDIEESSLLQGRYFLTIESESGKFDINDLASESKGLAKSVNDQLLKIITSESENNKEFRDKTQSLDYQEIINNIADYIDEDTESRNGSDEGRAYENAELNVMPPNQSLKTMEELNLVAGVTEDLYKLIEKRFTVYGSKGVNINYASKEVLSAIDPNVEEKTINEIISRRSNPELGGPFANEQDFNNFLTSIGIKPDVFNSQGIPLLFDQSFNFKVIGVGEFGGVSREITAVVYDVEQVKNQYVSIIEKDEKENSGDKDDSQPDPDKDPGKDNGSTPTKQKIPAPKGRPTVVYWQEN